MTEHYYYGLAALMYLTTCWTFAAVRWFHTCRQPKRERKWIWPDRRLQCLLYLCPTVLLPYIIDPTSPQAWMLQKSYFPATYYFYMGVLLLCFFGTVKQWAQWKTVSWIAALMVIAAMLPPVLGAWLPGGILNDAGLAVWRHVVMAESIVMAGYVMLAMKQVKRWLNEACDQNYSNPDDFPADYARRIWLTPLFLTPLIWPAYILDSPTAMAVQNVLLAVSNIVLLLIIMPVWRRKSILVTPETSRSHEADVTRADTDAVIDQTAAEIEAYVRDQQAYLDPHLKIDDVVAHCQHDLDDVSLTFLRRHGSFAAYVNALRLAHYDRYVADHPDETKEAAALAAGFTNYMAYYRALQKQKRERRGA